jgi:recombination protein RecR
MAYQAGPLADLIRELEKLPTIGPKTAARLAYYMLSVSRQDAVALADAIVGVKDRVRYCSRCFSLTENDPCAICTDPQRDGSLLCVVGEPKDVYAIERTMSFRGRYHVLGGRLSPLEGVGPEALGLDRLLARVTNGGGGADRVGEVIIATNPSMEGEVTATYLQQLLKPTGVRVTRIARGIPVGGDLEYADGVTIAQALLARRDMTESDTTEAG